MPKPVGTVNFSTTERLLLEDLAKDGISMVDAARRLGRSHSTVVHQIKKLGLQWRRPTGIPKAARREPVPRPYAWTEADDNWLLALHAAGWTQGFAANEMNRPTAQSCGTPRSSASRGQRATSPARARRSSGRAETTR